MGTTAQLRGVFPFWFGGPASSAAVQSGIGTVRGSQPDGSTDGAGCDRAHRHASESGQRGLHGLVRPARAGVHRSRAGLSGAGNPFAGRGNDPARGDRNSAAQHFCSRVERNAWYRSLPAQDRIAGPRRAGLPREATSTTRTIITKIALVALPIVASTLKKTCAG